MDRDSRLNLDAELRAVEDGHHLFYDDATRSGRVVSDSTPGLHWTVNVKPAGANQRLVFRCRPLEEEPAPFMGHAERWSPKPGRLPCKHAALLARRLERLGLARRVDGLWVATERPLLIDVTESTDPFLVNPFYGFPD